MPKQRVLIYPKVICGNGFGSSFPKINDVVIDLVILDDGNAPDIAVAVKAYPEHRAQPGISFLGVFERDSFSSNKNRFVAHAAVVGVGVKAIYERSHFVRCAEIKMKASRVRASDTVIPAAGRVDVGAAQEFQDLLDRTPHPDQLYRSARYPLVGFVGAGHAGTEERCDRQAQKKACRDRPGDDHFHHEHKGWKTLCGAPAVFAKGMKDGMTPRQSSGH